MSAIYCSVPLNYDAYPDGMVGALVSAGMRLPNHILGIRALPNAKLRPKSPKSRRHRDSRRPTPPTLSVQGLPVVLTGRQLLGRFQRRLKHNSRRTSRSPVGGIPPSATYHCPLSHRVLLHMAPRVVQAFVYEGA